MENGFGKMVIPRTHEGKSKWDNRKIGKATTVNSFQESILSLFSKLNKTVELNYLEKS